MLVAGGAGELEKYLQVAPYQRLGLGQPVGVLQQVREVVEVCGDFSVVRPKTPLINS